MSTAFRPGSAPRPSAGKVKVRHVEDQPCEGGGLHVLTNRGSMHGVVTFCVGCYVGWDLLDAEVNGSLATRRGVL